MGFFLFCSRLFPYGKEFSFRVKIEPPAEEAQKVKEFQVVIDGTKVNFKAPSGNWSEWTKVASEEIETIKKFYPNLYLGRYPLVISVRMVPYTPGAKISLEYDVDGKKYSAEALHFGTGPMAIGSLQWEEDGATKMGTMAQYNHRYWKEVDRAAGSMQVQRPKKLLIVDRFIGGDSDFYDWKEGLDNLSRIGCNAMLMSPGKEMREMLLKTGISKIVWAVYNPPGYAFDFDEKETSDTAIRKWAQDIAKPYLESGYKTTDMVAFGLSDEPGWYFPSAFKPVVENPKNLERFHDYLKAQGLKPTDFGFKSWNDWDKVKPLGRSAANKDLGSRKLHYWTCRFFPYVSYGLFARTTKALEEAFYPDMPITVNWNFFAGRYYFPGPFGNNPDKKSPDAAMGGHDWLEFGRARGSTCMWTEDWFGDGLAYQWSFYASKMKSAARKSNVQFGGYVIGCTAGEGVVQKMLTLFGHGAKLIKFYVFGPEYNFPGNCWSENTKVIKGIMKASTMAAKAEDYLYPGKPPIPQVAILTPQSSQVWDLKEKEFADGIVDATNVNQNNATTGYMAEVYDIYLALMHANIPCDFVDETDLLDQKLLANYKVLYVTAPNLPSECLTSLKKWVAAGGTVVTTFGACTADRYDEPSADFQSWAGIKVDEPAQPRLLLTWNDWKDAGKEPVETGSGRFTAAWTRGKILSIGSGTEVIAKFGDGSPAMLLKKSGRGMIIHYAFYPGLSYFYSQMASNKYQKDLPVGFSDIVRQAILFPVTKAGVVPFVSVSQPMIEAVLLMSEKGTAVTVLNWTGEKKEGVKLSIRSAGEISEVESITSGKVNFVRNGDTVTCEIPLEDVDILLLKK
jgi:hypothetical protein